MSLDRPSGTEGSSGLTASPSFTLVSALDQPFVSMAPADQASLARPAGPFCRWPAAVFIGRLAPDWAEDGGLLSVDLRWG